MTDRERFINCVLFRQIDRPPRWEWGFRSDATEKWYGQGLPLEVPEKIGWVDYFKLDRGCGYAGGTMAEKVGVDGHLIPHFGGEILAEDNETITSRNSWGTICKSSKMGASIPQYISFGLNEREDFAKFKERWNPNDPQRYPADWEKRKKRWGNRTYPISLFTYGWYGVLREMMGVEGLSVAFYEMPELIAEISEFWGDFIIQLFDRALREVDVDYVLFWEDLAFKTGPLLSPKHFRDFFLPHYKRVIASCKKHGVKIFMVDSDGNIDQIIPLWLEAGVNLLAPFEVAASMDVVAVGKKYGRDLAMIGGIEKMEILRGRLATEREILRRVPPLLERGGYIPTLDHGVLPGTSLQDYLYYREFLTKTCETSGY